jgi:hypothetical protein
MGIRLAWFMRSAHDQKAPFVREVLRLGLDESRRHNRWRVLCEFYAKLIALLIPIPFEHEP